MLRWFLLLATLFALLLMFLGPSPGWVALGFFGFLFGSIASTLAFAHARISSHARHEDVAAHQMTRPHVSRPPSPSGPDEPDSD